MFSLGGQVVASGSSLSVLLLLLFLALGQGWYLLLHCRLDCLESFVLSSEDALLPDEHFVEFSVRDEDLIEAAQVFILVVHHTQHPQSVVGGCLDRVPVQGEVLQVIKLAQLLRLF